MANYSKTTNFGTKDTLPTGDSQKIIRGSEFDTEFDNIATAITSKLDSPASSANVNFLQSGAAAVSRTAESKLRESVSPDDFGAVGDGVTNDTNAFNLAIAATSGEVVLSPNKTYAVNLVITKRGTRINGRSGDNLSVAPQSTMVKNLIPFDPSLPVIKIGNNTNYVGGCVIENLSIWSQSPSGTHGTIGLDLNAGAYANTVRNVQIGSSFSQHNLRLISGSTYANAYNQIYNVQLWHLSNVNTTAVLGAYYGSTFCVANFISNCNITGPGGTGTGHAVVSDSVDLYLSNIWIQANSNKGIKLDKNYSTFPRIKGSNVAIDSDSSSDILIESTVASDTALLPVNFLFGTITVDGFYKNAAASTKTLLGYNSFVGNDSLLTFPIFYGSPEIYNPTSDANVVFASVSGASNNVFFGNSTNTNSAYLVSGTGNVFLAPGNVSRVEVGNNYLRPFTDNVTSLGGASYRWTEVFAATGTINTSDEREKQDISALDDAEKRVAIAIKGLVKKFRFKDAVQKKGDGARIHVGVIVQDVMAAFQAEGLDPMRYGIVCYDQWEENPEVLSDDGTVISQAVQAGDRYGVRYEELLAFVISAL